MAYAGYKPAIQQIENLRYVTVFAPLHLVISNDANDPYRTSFYPICPDSADDNRDRNNSYDRNNNRARIPAQRYIHPDALE